MIVSLIAAVDKNFGIGLNNAMPWGYIKEDMRFFRSITNSSTVIMGRYTFESMGSKALKNRKNIVITKNTSISNSETDNLYFRQSLDETICDLLKNKEREVFIIGGEQIYKNSIDYADRIYLTHIAEDYNCDRFFPQIDEKLFSSNKIHQFIFNDRVVKILRYDRVKEYSFL